MHRLMLIQLNHDDPNHFRVIADSADASVSEASPAAVPAAAGGAGWEEFDDSTGFSSPYATVPCEGKVSDLGYWYVNKTGNVLDYDFVAMGLSERKVITSGELHVEYNGRRYVAKAGDSMLFLTDPADSTPFLVRFLGDHECTVVYTEYVLP
ncbi:MAG: hypothetical protein OXG19_04535 [Chloroflexi bacterium]|nr:hypothetical protein [Chloroflexota bacterium]